MKREWENAKQQLPDLSWGGHNGSAVSCGCLKWLPEVAAWSLQNWLTTTWQGTCIQWVQDNRPPYP